MILKYPSGFASSDAGVGVCWSADWSSFRGPNGLRRTCEAARFALFGIVTEKLRLPSGKRLHNYGTSPFSMGKSTISTGPFSIAMLNYQRVEIKTMRER